MYEQPQPSLNKLPRTPAEQDAYERQKEATRRELERKRVERRPGESALSHALRVRVRGSLLRAGIGLRPAINHALGRYSKIGHSPWIDPSQFEWVPELEQSFEAIRKEAEQVLEARATLPPLYQISPDHSRIDSDDGKWKVYFLKGYGFWLDRHCQRCPETARAVRRIPRHRGPTRAIFTAHLGLLVPRDRELCRIRVNRITGYWDPGKVICFDDTYMHQVRNDTDEDRVILLLHIRRPLRFPGNLLGRLVFGAIKWSPFVQDGLRNQRRWEERLARDEGGGRTA